MNMKTGIEAPTTIDLFTLEREVRQMRAVELARLGNSLREWVLTKLSNIALIGGKTAKNMTRDAAKSAPHFT